MFGIRIMPVVKGYSVVSIFAACSVSKLVRHRWIAQVTDGQLYTWTGSRSTPGRWLIRPLVR